MITDLTQGSISKRLWLFSIPMLISVMFQQIYNIADSMIAGKFVGEDALAAVGASYPVTMLFMAVAMGCNIGCSVVISQYFGAKRLSEMKTAVSTTFLASGGLSAVLTVGGLLFGKVMYKLTGGKVNPLIGSASVSAVPMAARVSQKVGQAENPGNFLLMHAMGPNVAGVIGSAVAAGVLLAIC